MTIARTGLVHPKTGLPLLPVGFRKDGRPIMPILGAAPDDDVNDDDVSGDDDADDSGDDADDDTDDDDSKPFTKEDGSPFTRKDYEALQESLRKARRDARAAKRGGKDDDKGGKDGKDADAIRAEVESEVSGRWKDRVVRTAARSALTEAGLIGKPDRLLKLLDMDEIDVDPEDDEIDGLTEQITDLKREYPHLFRKKGTRNLDAADKDLPKPRDKMTTTEIQAAQLRGEF